MVQSPQKNQPKYTSEESYKLCMRLAKTHYENFTVASWLLPEDKRKHIYAIYAFCRTVDDLGDEHVGDRVKALDEWELDLRKCYNNVPHHPFLVALQETIHTFDIPITPFLKLIQANRIDQSTTRYQTYKDLEYYCEHSANPVGHLILYIFEYQDEGRRRLSDYTCSALQLSNFWQDVGRDYDMGRIYIPLEDMQKFGYTENQLAQKLFTSQFRNLMEFEVEKTTAMFLKGIELVKSIDGHFKLDVALYSIGGMKILDAIKNQGYNVLAKRPELSQITKYRLMINTIIKLSLSGKFSF